MGPLREGHQAIIVLVSKSEIDDYLAEVGEPKRTTLQELRETILSIVPDAEQGISYQVPAFRLHGAVVAGFAAFKNHLSYLPFSGSVFPVLKDELAGYKTTSGALHFPVDKALPRSLVKKLIDVRLRQIRDKDRHPSTKSSVRRATRSASVSAR